MITKIKENAMQLKKSKIMIIISILCIIAVAVYFVSKNTAHTEEQAKPITYETINMLTNLRLGISEYDSIHPYITKNREIIYLNRLIFEPLLTITQEYKITTCLAKEWSKVGEKTYIIKLKENLKWSDGASLTAQDVKFSIEQLKQSTDSIYYENVKNIQEIEVLDAETIRIELDTEIPFFEYYLIFPIISKNQYENEDIAKSDKIPIGTGRYQIKSIEESKIELVQNKEWRDFENENSNLKTVTVYLYKTMGEVYNAFKLGNVDLFHTATRNIEEYIGSMGYGKKVYEGREYDYLALNCQNNILQYQEVRKAIQLTINQENIVASSLENKVEVADFPLEKVNYLRTESEKENASSNIEKAKKLLEENGWKYEYGIWQKQIGGRTKTININLAVSKSNEQRVKVAQEIQKQLETLGIKVVIQEISDEEYKEYLENHKYEMLLTGVYTSLSPDLSNFFGQDNLANYNNPEITAILKELSDITEDELRKQKYEQIIKIYEEDVPYIGLYRNQETVAYSSKFRGEVTPNNYHLYYHFADWYRQE